MLFSRVFCYRRFLCICAVFLVFSVVYLVACDHDDFGGVSQHVDALRDELAEQAAERHLRRTETAHASRSARHAVTERYANTHVHALVRPPPKYTWDRWFNMLYFSVNTVSTLGMGDVYPLTRRAKVLVVAQILCLFLVLCVRD